MIYTTLLTLAEAAPNTQQQPGLGNMLVPFACIGVIFYFLIIRPQTKKQKEHETLVKSLKTGDKVVTSGGIHGLVSNVKDTTVIVKVADNVKLEIEKSAVSIVTKRLDNGAVTPA